jgi:hypothetical protein
MGSPMNTTMRYTLPPPGVDPKQPLIYMWEIADASGQVIGRYIGKANGGEKRPRQHYARNVEKLLGGKPYKNGKDYRRVHYALAQAVVQGHAISLQYLCNVPEDLNIFEVETRYIHEYGCNIRDGIGLNGPGKISRPDWPVMVSRPDDAHSSHAEEQTRVDLEDFLELVEDHYPRRFRIVAGAGRYSLWIGRTRILRARQSGPRGKIRIKLVPQSKGAEPVEFTWNGSEGEVLDAVERQLRLLDAGDTTLKTA